MARLLNTNSIDNTGCWIEKGKLHFQSQFMLKKPTQVITSKISSKNIHTLATYISATNDE